MNPPARAWQAFGLGTVLVTLTLVGLWSARRPLIEAAVTTYLDSNGVRARYRLAEASGRQLVFRAVVLGQPAHPDLVAQQIVVTLAWAGINPHISDIRLVAPRFRATVTDTGVSFGSLDRLIPPGRTDRFPAIAVTIIGGIARIATPVGPLVARIDAAGRLDRDFRALVQTSVAALKSPACQAIAAPIRVTVATRLKDFTLDAGGAVHAVNCATVAAPQIDWSMHLVAPLTLARLDGDIALRANAVGIGTARFSAPASLKLWVQGSPTALHGPWQIADGGLRAGGEAVRSLAGQGGFDWRPASGVALSGKLAAHGIASGTIHAVLADTALPTIAAALAARLAAVSREVDADIDFAVASSVPVITVSTAEVRGSEGARLHFNGAARWSPRLAEVDGVLDLAGGGLPTARARLAKVGRTDTAWAGSGALVIAPWRAGLDIVAVPDLRMAIKAGIVRIDGHISASTGFPGGRVDDFDLRLGASLDIAGNTIVFGPGCADIAADRIQVAAVTLGRFATRMCPQGLAIGGNRFAGGVAVAATRLAGMASGKPFVLTAGPALLSASGTLDRPRMGSAGVPLRLAIGGVTAAAAVSGLVGPSTDGWTGAGGLTDIAVDSGAAVARRGAARWRIEKSVVTLFDGDTILGDPAAQPRFATLRLHDIGLTVSADRIAGQARIGLSVGGQQLANVVGSYSPSSGKGSAQVDSTLAFSKQLQPLMISELARGLVANVDGKVVSHADLAIDGARVLGTATVRFDNIALATASLGPVTGIDGTLVFDDLPALHTPPHQELKIGSINPGVLVENGVAKFAIDDASTIAVETMRWPFAGGTLTLQPVVLRVGATRRAFNLAVEGLDAGQFLQRFDLKNLNATGTFDGALPLAFEANVGRIEGGRLTARPAGGTIQYVGEVGQDSMGGAARLAFDALRRLRYHALTLTLDGDLDGELVTAVNFAGTNEQAVRLGGALPIRSSGLPFKFAVTVRAPFRALLGSAASLSDARDILHSAATQPAGTELPVDAVPMPRPKP